MAYAARIWPIEFAPDVALGEWRSLPYLGRLGQSAPWRFEPPYWRVSATIPGKTAVRSGWYFNEYEMSREELRELDAQFRVGIAPDWWSDELAVLDRALAPTSPFTRFSVAVFEWESGLE